MYAVVNLLYGGAVIAIANVLTYVSYGLSYMEFVRKISVKMCIRDRSVAEAMYNRFDMKRVFYSAFVNVNMDESLPGIGQPPPLKLSLIHI